MRKPSGLRKSFHTAAFEKLRALWDQKLEASGFVDIEKHRGVDRSDEKVFGCRAKDTERLLKRHHALDFGGRKGMLAEQDGTYYAEVEHLLAATDWTQPVGLHTAIEQAVWPLVNQYSLAEIATKLNMQSGIVRRTVHAVRVRLRYQRDVWAKYAEGFTTAEIASQLDISNGRVLQVVKSMKAKIVRQSAG